jgi:hypothetical protein
MAAGAALVSDSALLRFGSGGIGQRERGAEHQVRWAQCMGSICYALPTSVFFPIIPVVTNKQVVLKGSFCADFQNVNHKCWLITL